MVRLRGSKRTLGGVRIARLGAANELSTHNHGATPPPSNASTFAEYMKKDFSLVS